MNGSLLPLCVFVIVTSKCFFDYISVFLILIFFLSASIWLNSSCHSSNSFGFTVILGIENCEI